MPLKPLSIMFLMDGLGSEIASHIADLLLLLGLRVANVQDEQVVRLWMLHSISTKSGVVQKSKV